MTRMFLAATAVSFVIGTTAYAGTPSSVRSGPSSKILAFNSHGTVTTTLPIFSAGSLGVPGATGRTIVPGNRSTVADDAAATLTQQTGALGGGD